MFEKIPIFPLGLIIFPGQTANLHVFEPRYKQLIQDCIDGDLPFGLPTYFDESIQTYGTLLKVKSVHKKYPDGKMDIQVKAIKRFQVIEILPFLDGKLYNVANVKYLNFAAEPDPTLLLESQLLIQSVFNILGVQKQVNDFSCYKIAKYLGLGLHEEYELLKLNSEKSAQQQVVKYLQKMLPVLKKSKRIKEQILMNGHFKNFDPIG